MIARKHPILTGLLISVLLVIGWMNRYEYTEFGFGQGRSFPIKVHRFTGEAEILRSGDDGFYWEEISSENPLKDRSQSSSSSGLDDELGRLINRLPEDTN